MFSAYLAQKHKPTGNGFEPIYYPDSTLLILNCGNSKTAYEKGVYYWHEHNKLWKILATSFSMITPNSIDEKDTFEKYKNCTECFG